MQIVMKSKVTVKELLSPRDPPPDGTPKILGIIFGAATGTKLVKMPNGDVFTGLVGMFGAVPEGKEGEILIRSGACYLPTSFQDELIATLNSAEGQQVRFAYRVMSQHSTSPAGYQYAAINLMPPAATDPLTAMLAGIPAIAQPVEPEHAHAKEARQALTGPDMPGAPEHAHAKEAKAVRK